MIFHETDIDGAFWIEPEPHHDLRGFFARTWCSQQAREHGIEVEWVQCNLSHNLKRGTLRGMHYQFPKFEAKLVRVERGSIYDAIVDIRPDSPTYLQKYAKRLDGESCHALFVPAGCAHGFLSLEDDTRIFYQMSEYYRPEQGAGFHYADPRFGIEWPLGELGPELAARPVMNERDRKLGVYSP